MRIVINKSKVIAVIVLILLLTGCSQKKEKIVGTIGKEKINNSTIVICVYGTKACMPVKIDSNQTIKYQGIETKLAELPFGLYVEINIDSNNNENKVNNISINETKTVICFNVLSKEQETQLSNVLNDVKGINKYKIHPETKQLYIEYEPQIINYKEIESKLINKGFEIE